MRRAIGYALLAAILAGCGVKQTDQTEALLIASEKLATNYIRLPLCTPATRPICSDAAVSARIKQADNAAYEAFKAWQKNPSSTNQEAVTAALAALSATVPDLAAAASPPPAKP